jgi:hypothetical protein
MVNTLPVRWPPLKTMSDPPRTPLVLALNPSAVEAIQRQFANLRFFQNVAQGCVCGFNFDGVGFHRYGLGCAAHLEFCVSHDGRGGVQFNVLLALRLEPFLDRLQVINAGKEFREGIASV